MTRSNLEMICDQREHCCAIKIGINSFTVSQKKCAHLLITLSYEQITLTPLFPHQLMKHDFPTCMNETRSALSSMTSLHPRTTRSTSPHSTVLNACMHHAWNFQCTVRTFYRSYSSPLTARLRAVTGVCTHATATLT